MILLDSDVLLIDLRYPNDAKYAVSRQALIASATANSRVPSPSRRC
jgi:hypothetical protein